MTKRKRKLPLTSFDLNQSIDVIWAALHSHRENCIPEGVKEYDAEWDDICTAMAWITEALGITEENPSNG